MWAVEGVDGGGWEAEDGEVGELGALGELGRLVGGSETGLVGGSVEDGPDQGGGGQGRGVGGRGHRAGVGGCLWSLVFSSSRLLVFSSSRLLVRKTGTTTTRSRAEKKNSPKLAHDLSLCTLYDTTHVGCIRTMSVSSVGRGRSRAGAETGLALALARSTCDPPTRKPPGVFAPAVSRSRSRSR